MPQRFAGIFAIILMVSLVISCSSRSAPTPTSVSAPTLTPTAIPTPTPEPTQIPLPTPKPDPTATPEPTSEPPDMLFTYTQAVQLLGAAQYEEAVTAFDRVIRVLPEFARAYNYRGIAYFHQERWELALEDFDKSIELKKTFPDVFRNRASVHREMGNTRSAIEDLELALKLYREIGDIQSVNEIETILDRVAGH